MIMAFIIWAAAIGLVFAVVTDKIIDHYKSYRTHRHYDGGCEHSPTTCYYCNSLREKRKTNAHS